MFLKKFKSYLFRVFGILAILLLCLKIDDEFRESLFSIEDSSSVGVDIVTVSDGELDYAMLKSLNTEDENIVVTSKRKNNDIKAWINIIGTKIDYPVLFSGDDFYLTHNELKDSSNKGAIYIDKCTPPDSDLVIVNGHNMKSGEMFAKLLAYKSEDYAKRHCYIEWTTDCQSYNYKIFAVCIVPSNYLDNLLLRRQAGLESMINMLKYDAKFNFETSDTDQILVLNTCTYEFSGAHLLICAYKMI